MKRIPLSLKVRLWSGALWRLALAGLLIMLAWRAYQLRELPEWLAGQVAAVRADAVGAIHAEGGATRSAALSAIADTRRDVLAQVAAIRTNTMARIDTGLKMADSHLASIDTATVDVSRNLNGQITRTGDSVVKVSTNLEPVLVHAGAVAKQIDDAAPMYLDCTYYDDVTGQPIGGNPDCVFNRFQGTSEAFEKTMQEVAKAAPRIADTTERLEDSAASIAASTDKEVQQLMKPRKWWQKVIDYINLAAIAAAHAI